MTASTIASPVRSKPQLRAIAISSIAYDWLFAALCLIFVAGVFLDGWAHNHGRVDESFFTPWHAVFYSGFMIVALALLGTTFLNWQKGLRGAAIWPSGYRLSATGLLIFAAGGFGDMLWHEIFGIEDGIEALISPSHLTLGLGMGLIVTGPLRAAWNRANRAKAKGQELATGWWALGPMVLSILTLTSIFTFLFMFSHPLFNVIGGPEPWTRANDVNLIVGYNSLILIATFLMGPLMFAMRRWQLPIGTFALVWGINSIGMVILDWLPEHALGLTIAFLVAGVLVEIIRLLLRPSAARPGAFHLFAFLAPFTLYLVYFATMIATAGTHWSVHMWSGSAVMSATVVWLISYLVLPPREVV
ncbi:MAG: hypothetical protein AAF639_39650 [Chloroflexota bacterium]